MLTFIQKIIGALLALFQRPLQAGPILPPMPLTFNTDGFKIRVETSHIVTTNLATWRISAAALNEDDVAYDELKLRASFFRNSEHLGDVEEELQRGQALLFPGDTLPIDLRMPLPEGTTRVVATLIGERSEDAEISATPISLIMPPPGISLQERQHVQHWFGDGSQGFCHLTIEIHNEGKPIKLLKLNTTFKLKSGDVCEERTVLPTYEGAPTILQGERRLAHVIARVPKTYSSYELEIGELERV